MSRRRTPALVATTLLTLGLAACSTDAAPATWSPAAEPSTTATPAAEAPRGRAPEKAFAIGVRQLTLNRDGDRPLPVTLWYPARGESGGTAKRSAPAAGGRFPVVVFSHGLSARPADYAALLTRWAAAGFVVAAPTFPNTSRGAAQVNPLDVLNQPADVSYVLTEVLALDGRAGDPLRGRLATDRVAAAGHSAGGVTTIGLFTLGRDERLGSGVVLAGTALGVGSAFAGTAAPQLFVHGELDEVVDYSAGRAAYDRVPWPKAMLSLPRGDHGRALLADGASLRVVADTTVEFLRWSLYGDDTAKRRLPADAARGGLATLDNRL
ncbi:alpha/beta hydrolase family protein [Micromonospora inyonensis]|uniref:Alpha/beta hydrolase family protein n=1 Tax=Micromonospora inyonensis TaxID=47866 RepID=A0A1C6R8B5_9ACTN|nr:chlorophyllase [Micromonospora inyonensis]SCL13305.1 Alpha/beta hydrolase family protein [Micromonospora inyonensis]